MGPARLRILTFCGLLALTAASTGCCEIVQFVAGPTVDERGGVGGMIKVRVSSSFRSVGLAASGEAAGTQSEPHGVFGVGLGPIVAIAGETLMGVGGVRVLAGVSPRGSFVGLVGGHLSLAREFRHRDTDAGHSCISWWVGGELAADYAFGDAPRSLLLSPGVVVAYRLFISD